jgi:predicted PurR-regulated permease PerM
MKKSIWPVVAVTAIFALGFVSALAMRPRSATVEIVSRGPSAATTIILFLLAVLGVLVGLVVAAVVVWQVLRTREQTRRMEQTALLFGAKSTPSTPRPRPAVRPGSDGGTVIMIGGGGGQPRVEDLRQ